MATYSDPFTGTNGNAISTSLWTVTSGLTGPVIRSNAARGNATGSAVSSAYSKTAVGADQSMQANATAAPASAVSFLAVRQAAAADTCYAVGFESFDNGVDPVAIQLSLYRIVAGAKTLLAAYQPDPATSPGAPTSTVQLIAEGTGSAVTLTVKVAGVTVSTYADTNAARLTTGQPGIRFTGNSTTYLVDNASWGDYTAASVPCTVALPTASSGTTAGTMTAGASVIVALPAASSETSAGTLGHPSDVTIPAASTGTTAGTFSVSSVVPPLYSDAFGGADGAPLASPWTKIGGSGSTMPVNKTGGVAQAGSGTIGAFYNQPISDGQYAEVTLKRLPIPQTPLLSVQANANRRGYALILEYDDTGTGVACVGAFSTTLTASDNGTISTAAYPALAVGDRLRIECAGKIVRFKVNDATLIEWTDPIWAGAALTGGFPAVLPFSTFVCFDDFAAGPTPVPCTVALPAASTVTEAKLGLPASCTVALPTASTVTEAKLGLPAACTVALPAASSVTSAGPMTAKASKVKATAVYPHFSAFGGTDSYSGNTKGQIAADGDLSIGYRVGLGNDGVSGDRVFLSVPQSEMVRADVPTNPVAKATLHLTFLSMMSWDYLATGAAANPSGVAFKVRKVTDGSGMSATLSGDYGTINAKPTWLSGQTWYDGNTRGNPVWECEVDVTSLYNEAAEAGTALYCCLECQFTNTKWLAEIVGSDPNLAWAKPRIEVHRWGEVGISLSDTDTCTPTISVTPPGTQSFVVRWGYDSQCTPQGGSQKYAGITWVHEGESASSPYTLPMLESSTRVHVEVEVDFGAGGSLLFRRTFKTPQVFKPKLEPRSELYTNWLDVRGPVNTSSIASCEQWHLLVKRAIPAHTEGNTYGAGDPVVFNGGIYYATNATSYRPPLAVTPLPGNAADAGMTVMAGRDIAYRCNAAHTIAVGENPAASAYWDNIGWPGWRLSPSRTSGCAAGNYWGFYRCTNEESQYVFKPHVGSVDATVMDTSEPLPYPAAQTGTEKGSQFSWKGLGYAVQGAAGLDLAADDVSEPCVDPTNGNVSFLSSHLVGGSYEVRLWIAWFRSSEVDWGKNNWPNTIYTSGAGGTLTAPVGKLLYTATAAPDLKNCAALSRAVDHRRCIGSDCSHPMLAAFVADGSLRVYAVGPYDAARYVTGEGVWCTILSASATIRSELTRAVSVSPTKLRFLHSLTLAGKHRSVLVAEHATDGLVCVRSDDAVIAQSGGGHATTDGTWSVSARPLARAWVSEPLPSNSNGHIPDDETAHIAVQAPDAAVTFMRAGGGATSGAGADLAPDADFATDATYSRTKRVIGRWPVVTGYNAQVATANGGCANLKASGSTLTVQRVSDFCRVSDEAIVTLAAEITEIHGLAGPLWEGVPCPVVTKHADGYRLVLLTVGVDLSRMYLATPVLRERFRSGKLTTANVSRASLNMRAPGDFVQRAGHNAFAIGWTFDPFSNPLGMMNEAGWNYFAFQDCRGERIRLLVHDTPAFGGKWRDGVLKAPTYDSGYQPEALGGCEWMQQKFSTWWWTNDPPSSPDRQWRRVLDGMDYVLDGESGGGMYVVTMESPEDTLYLAHDPVHDPASWRGEAAAWLSGPGATKIKWTNAKGELLYGVGASATTPISEVDFE